MKKIFLLLVFTFICGIVFAQEVRYPFSDHIESLWIQGKSGMSQVKSISDQLLIEDPDNLVGLIIKLQYESNHMLFDKYLNTRSLILQTSEDVGSLKPLEIFINHLPDKEKIELIRKLYKEHPEYLERDLSLVGRPGVPMTFINVIRGLEQSGFVSMNNIEERKPFSYYWAAIPVILLAIGFIVYLRRSGKKVEDASA